MPSTPSPNRPDSPPSIFLAIRLAWDLGFIIAIPIAVLGFGGAYLDRTFGTSPFLLLIGFVLAIVITTIGLKRKLTTILSPSKK
ncbi:MAG: AtpZ/AtpI family protein [Candidatus Peribacteraceae bacterium]|nr:AtpZ/AtpI family protein [Candidatus Peribacteraceae bacterium]